MPNEKEKIDAFWDLSSLAPKRTQKAARPVTDTEPVTLSVGESAPAGSEPIPARSAGQYEKPRERAKKITYECETGAIRKVEIIPWESFTFYSKFHSDAIKYFRVEGEACEPEAFFSYMPQYEQLSVRQMRYYFYFRMLIRGGTYPDVSSSYIFLYLYETINVPELLSPEQRLETLCRVWLAYREKYPYLDKYIGEWVCDLCLIHRIAVPDDVSAALPDAVQKLSLPELFIGNGALPMSMISTISGYDLKKSKAYPGHEKEYEKYLPPVIVFATQVLISEKNADIPPSHAVRDSFSGAIACAKVKFKITVTYSSLQRSKEIKQLISSICKACENELRAALGIKSRFAAGTLPESVTKVIKDYFDDIYPDRRRKSGKTDDDDAPYMKYYAPRRVGEADTARAILIERDAWETAALLEPEAVACDAPTDVGGSADAVGAYGARTATDVAARRGENSEEAQNEYENFILGASEDEVGAISAAADGTLTEYCRGIGVMREEMIRRINELAYEYTGDIVLSDDGEPIEDYADELSAAIKKFKEV